MLCRHMKKLCRFVVPVAVSCHLSIKYAAVHFMISFCSGTKVRASAVSRLEVASALREISHCPAESTGCPILLGPLCFL